MGGSNSSPASSPDPLPGSPAASNELVMQEKPMLLNANETGNDVTHVPRSTSDVPDDGRQTWGKKADFLLSVIGFAVDLANVWRFPYLCYKNGGGAFLIPYVLMLGLAGIPLFYMELALGQYHRKGAITCWGRICPLIKGVGYAVVLIAFYTDFFYNIIIAWALHYFFASFTSQLPWTSCSNDWNTDSCYDAYDDDDVTNTNNATLSSNITATLTTLSPNVTAIALNVTTNVTTTLRNSPALEYFERGMLQLDKERGIESVGSVRWQLALCLLAVYVICYFSLWKGISTSGKVVWFTALFPYVVLLILLVRGVTLPGSAKGIRYYLNPDLSKLKESEVWVDAATQVFFSLGPGFGVLLAFASYNKFRNNVYADALATSTINCLTSFLSGFVIFSVLGYMSERTGKHIRDVATEGPGLVFVVYPEAIATLPASTFWSIIFFMMLLTLGLDSSFGGSEAIITALSDEFALVRNHREIFVGCLFTFYFMVGLGSCTQGGAYVVRLMDHYAAGYSILMAVLFETLAVSWLYGVDRFAEDIKSMLGFKPGVYWRLCWKFVAPLFLCSIMIFGFATWQPLTYDETYEYPLWANLLGWCIALSSICCMPVLALYQIIRTPGSLSERVKWLIIPWRDKETANVLNHDSHGSIAAQTV